MSELKMNTFDAHNTSPITSRDSYSGSYRNFQMSYECMLEVRKIESKIKILESGLHVASEQLLGISLGINKHRQNMSYDFFIQTAYDNSVTAQKALKEAREL